MKYFMHTINGFPASYSKREGHITYMSHHGNRKANRLATSIKQIKAEQRASCDWRAKRGLSNLKDKMGYVIVHVPEQEGGE